MADQEAVRRVLVADDEPVVRDLLRTVLECLGFQVTACGSGAEALARLRAESHAAVVCDYALGDLDGISLHRALIQEGNPAASRMILVTGDATEPALDAFVASTGTPVLPKPFHMSDLSDLLHAITGGQRPPISAAG